MAENKVMYSVTLSDYVRVLQSVARGAVRSVPHDDSVERRLLHELRNAGLISDLATHGRGGITYRSEFCVTPQGANALITWKDYLWQQSRWGKALRFATQGATILFGGLAATVPAYLLERL